MQETDVTIVWSFRNRLDVLQNSLLKADKYFPKGVKFLLIDAASNEDTIKDLRLFCNNLTNRNVKICESFYRSSLSQAWNLGLMLSDTKFVIFSSSDVDFHSEMIFDLFKKRYEETKSKYILLENHAVFMLERKIVKTVGWFDEEFVLGPHFDCDYMIRASEEGVRVSIIERFYNGIELYTHCDSGEVIAERMNQDVQDRLPMHDRRNDYIFKEKWLTAWEGWHNYPRVVSHPPTHISQVVRKRKEIDPHPCYTSKL